MAPPGFQAQNNHAPNFQNQGFQNQPFQVPNNHVQQEFSNDFSSYKRNNDQMMRNMQNQINSLKGDLKNEIQNMIKSQQAVMMNQQTTFQNNLQNMICGLFQNQASTSGTLPSNTIPNPKGEMKAITTRSGVAYEGPSIPTNPSPKKVVERETEETMDKGKTNFQGSTAQIPSLVIPIPEPDVPKTLPKTTPIPEPDVPKNLPKPNIPYPSRLNQEKFREKASYQKEKIFQMFQDLRFDISFADALFFMPRFAPTIRNLLMNKEKLLELAKIPLNENCSAMLLKKLPEKLGDPGKFLIPCNFPGMDVCHALADLGASINLMPLSFWKKLSLPELTPTRMTLELADRSITHPKGLAEDVYVKVGKFHFPTDFVVVDFEADPRVPLILGRSFLRTDCALIDVYGEEITLRVDNEAITFNLDQTTRYSSTNDKSVNRIDIIDAVCEEYAPKLLGFSNNDSSGGNPTPTSEPFTSEFILEEIEAYLKDDSISPEIDHADCDPEGDICLIEKLLNNDPFQLPPMDLKQSEVTKAKSSIEEPPELELKDLPSHLEYAYLEENDKLPVIIAKGLKDDEKDALLKVLKSHKRAIAWKITDIKGIDPHFCTHKILMEDDYKPTVQSQRRVNPKIHEVIKKEVLKLLDAGMIYPISDSPWVSPVHCVPKKGGITVVANEENELIPTRLVTGWRVCIDYRKLNEATRKDHFPLPFMDQMLERLAGNEFYCFLDGFSGYFQIPIDPQDQEKTTFTCPYGTFAYRRMPFGLCNAPGTFQRCMMAIFHDMIEKTMEVFMDDFSVFGDSFDSCLSNLEKMLKRCEDTNLVLNWEKCHFMCREGIVLGHKISKSGIEVDHAKVDVIAKLPHPTTVKGVRSFLGHADIKKKLTEAPILVVPDWNLPFELMCDASDFAIGAVLGQRKMKHFQPIHYASKTMTEAQIHYTTTEKEMLAVVYAFEKFRPYLVLSKSIVYTDHSALKYLMNKQDAKPRLTYRVVLSPTRFESSTIRDKKRNSEIKARMQNYTRYDAQSFYDSMIFNMDSSGNALLSCHTKHLFEKKTVIQEIASSNSVRNVCWNSETKECGCNQIQDVKIKKKMHGYFRSLHSPPSSFFQKNDLKGTALIMDSNGHYLLAVNNQFLKFIDSQFTLDYDNQMTDKYFVEYTGIEVKHFKDTLLQHMGNVKKFVAEKTRHQRRYDRRVNKRQMQTQESKIDTSKAVDADLVVTKSNGTKSEVQDEISRSENDTDTDDADIRPIYDEEPMADVQLTAECNILKSLMKVGLARQHGHILNEISNKAKMKKEIEAFKTINIELEHSVAKLLTENEHLNKVNETLKKHYKDLYDSIKVTRSKTIEQTTSLLANNADLKAQIQEKVLSITTLKNDLRKLKGNSVDTKFAKTSVLEKPVLQSLKNQSVVRQPNAFKSERPHMSKQRFAS
ncbi:reverse transcriptase domain-containing protein [Tanacetum coccineum]